MAVPPTVPGGVPLAQPAQEGALLRLTVVAREPERLILQLLGRLYAAPPLAELHPGTVLKARLAARPGTSTAPQVQIQLRLASGTRTLTLEPLDSPAPLRAPERPPSVEPTGPLRLVTLRADGQRLLAELLPGPSFQGPAAAQAGEGFSLGHDRGDGAFGVLGEQPSHHATALVEREEVRGERGRMHILRITLALQHLGPIRLELLAAPRGRHLVVRSARPLPQEARRTIADLFGAALELAGQPGRLLFARLDADAGGRRPGTLWISA